MTDATMLSQPITRLAGQFAGELIRPSDSSYDAQRQVHNGMIDRRPALIARCATTDDIGEAIIFARENELEIAVRGGGHSPAGRAVVDDGILIDLSAMKEIQVDEGLRTAVAQGGVTWGELNEATQEHGLATTGGVVSTTGVGGLTLGGGFGYLQAKHGLAIDNLLAVEIVTADGSVLTVSEDRDPDLFWAVRGGGGNFGVISEFTFQLHEVGPTIYGGIVAHPLDQAPDVFRFFRDLAPTLPDEASLQLGMIHAPDGSGAKLVAIFGGHCGPLDEGEAVLKPVEEFGSPAMAQMGPMPYSALNTMLDDGFPKGALSYWKSSFMDTLSDDAIDKLAGAFAACPAPMSGIVVEHLTGAATRADARATAFPHRDGGFNLILLAQWMDPSLTDESVKWLRDSYDGMRPFLAGDQYVNYQDRDDDAAAASAYGVNLERLREVKAQYDPENVFHLNQNIEPAV